MLTEVDARVRVRLGMDRATGKPRGFAFAEFSDAAKAADAIRRFDALELRGRRLRVNDADDKPPARAGSPPRGPRPGGAPSGMPSSFGAGGGFGDHAFTPDPGFNPGGDPPFRRKGGSRRGLRGKKRSLR